MFFTRTRLQIVVLGACLINLSVESLIHPRAPQKGGRRKQKEGQPKQIQYNGRSEWIVCADVLPLFDYTLPTRPLRDNLTHLCAREDLGGLPGTIGSSCIQSPGSVEITIGDPTPYWDTSFRLAAFCYTKCRCRGDRRRAMGTVRQIHPLRTPEEMWELYGEGMEYGYIPDFVIETHPVSLIELDRKTTDGTRKSLVTKMMIPTDFQQYYHFPPASRIGFGVDPENDVICASSTDAPTFPGSRQTDQFEGNKKLCAVSLLGGHLEFNAGAYCHRSEDKSSADVWFTDELYTKVEGIPDTAQIFHPNNYQTLWKIRLHCYQHCRCRDSRWQDRDPRKSMSSIFRILQGGMVRGDIPNTPGGEAAPCGATGSADAASCSFSGLRLDSPRPGPDPSCGDDSCQSNNECISKSSPSCPYQARCAVDPRSARPSVGAGLASGVALLFGASRCLAAYEAPAKRLGGRNFMGNDPARHWPCACNASVVSLECCDSPAGIIGGGNGVILGGLRA